AGRAIHDFNIFQISSSLPSRLFLRRRPTLHSGSSSFARRDAMKTNSRVTRVTFGNGSASGRSLGLQALATTRFRLCSAGPSGLLHGRPKGLHYVKSKPL